MRSLFRIQGVISQYCTMGSWPSFVLVMGVCVCLILWSQIPAPIHKALKNAWLKLQFLGKKIVSLTLSFCLSH